jgi:hypothetical protein
MAYRLNMPPMGNNNPHGPVPDVLFPRTPAYGAPNTRTDGEMADGVRDQIPRMLREFGFHPEVMLKPTRNLTQSTSIPYHIHVALEI